MATDAVMPGFAKEYWALWPRQRFGWDVMNNTVFELQLIERYYGARGVRERGWSVWLKMPMWTLKEALCLEMCLQPDPFTDDESVRAVLDAYDPFSPIIEKYVLGAIRAGDLKAEADAGTYHMRPVDFIRWRERQDSSEDSLLGPVPLRFQQFLNEMSTDERDPQPDKDPHGNALLGAQRKGELIGVARVLLTKLASEDEKGTRFRKANGEANAAYLARYIWDSMIVLWPERADDPIYESGTMDRYIKEWLKKLRADTSTEW